MSEEEILKKAKEIIDRTLTVKDKPQWVIDFELFIIEKSESGS